MTNELTGPPRPAEIVRLIGFAGVVVFLFLLVIVGYSL